MMVIKKFGVIFVFCQFYMLTYKFLHLIVFYSVCSRRRFDKFMVKLIFTIAGIFEPWKNPGLRISPLISTFSNIYIFGKCSVIMFWICLRCYLCYLLCNVILQRFKSDHNNCKKTCWLECNIIINNLINSSHHIYEEREREI